MEDWPLADALWLRYAGPDTSLSFSIMLTSRTGQPEKFRGMRPQHGIWHAAIRVWNSGQAGRR